MRYRSCSPSQPQGVRGLDHISVRLTPQSKRELQRASDVRPVPSADQANHMQEMRIGMAFIIVHVPLVASDS